MGIKYDINNQDFVVKAENSLLELCLSNDVPINHVCEGGASCGTCRVIITQGIDQLEGRSALEQEMANDRGFEPQERLACQTSVKQSFCFILPKDRTNES